MNNIEFYKSQISDEEVIKALIKESKAREGELLKEKTRVRPNLNFFQRTVTNLVTSNKRISTTKDLDCTEIEKYVSKIRTKKKSLLTLEKNDLVTNKINFGKAHDTPTCVKPNSSAEQCNSSSQVGRTYKESLDKYFVRATQSGINTEQCNATTQPNNGLTHVEKTYKHNLDKYFVRATESGTNKKRFIQKRTAFNVSKSKNVLFNFNFNKSGPLHVASSPEKVIATEKCCTSVPKSYDNSVICVSESSSSSEVEDDVISISESDTE